MHFSISTFLTILGLYFSSTTARQPQSDFLYKRYQASSGPCCPAGQKSVPEPNYNGIMTGPCSGTYCVDSKTGQPPKPQPLAPCGKGYVAEGGACVRADIADKKPTKREAEAEWDTYMGDYLVARWDGEDGLEDGLFW
ncbi:hypothetical protein MMC10_010293 [Thelotrema lepadinum]|nr:hypothetical protein [Thelotrema lepadinum]